LKILMVLSVLALVSCSSSPSLVLGQTTIRGSGVLATEVRTVNPGCDQVVFEVAANLRVELNAQESLRIEAEDNLLGYLEDNVVGSTLQIQDAGGVDLHPTLPIEIDLAIAQLDELTHSGVGNVDILDPVSPHFSLTLTGVGELNALNYSGQTLDATLAGVGEIRVSGSVDSQTVTVSGVGEYEGAGLASVDAVVTVSSIGSATVRVSGTLDVTISGAGTVYYIGNPVITSNITGGGSLQKIG
jgi:hypothetical protein